MDFNITSEEISQLIEENKKYIRPYQEFAEKFLTDSRYFQISHELIQKDFKVPEKIKINQNLLNICTDSIDFSKISEIIEKTQNLTDTTLSSITKPHSDNVYKEKKEDEQELIHYNYKLGRLQKEVLLKLLKYSNNTTNFVLWNSTIWFSNSKKTLKSGLRSNLHKMLKSLVNRELIIHEKRDKRKNYVSFTSVGLRFTQKCKHLW